MLTQPSLVRARNGLDARSLDPVKRNKWQFWQCRPFARANRRVMKAEFKGADAVRAIRDEIDQRVQKFAAGLLA